MFHPEKDRAFHCTPDNLRRYIFCQERKCRSAEEIENGVLLSHVGCLELNPFWNGTRIEIPGELHESRAIFEVDFNTGVNRNIYVQHWQLGALRSAPSNVKEMWFPQMLLRATAADDAGARVGRLIELAGSRDAGKTILAIQAMNPNGYATPDKKGGVFLNNYIYSRRVGEFKDRSFRSFIEIMHLNSLLRRGIKEIYLPQGTPYGARNLRVAFIKPAGLFVEPGDGTLKGNVKRLSKIAWRRGRRFIIDDVSKSVLELFGRQVERPYWHTAVFYDKSGEVDENEDVSLDNLEKVAVVVNAAEIFGLRTEGGRVSEKSIEVAVQRINKAVERKQLCYLVVTQLDTVRERIKEDWEQVQQMADDLGNIGKDRSRFGRVAKSLFTRHSPSQRLVEKWLGTDPVGNRRQLRERLKDVEDIFFVWTENLPASRTPEWHDKLPTSHGLAKFVCRCLDITWEQINQGPTR
jgi:hypothetical protein